LGCYVGPANENDREGIKFALDNIKMKYNTILKILADMGYQGHNLKEFIKHNYKIDLEIIKRPPTRFWVRNDMPVESLPTVETGFKIQPKRWIVERTFAWLNRNRRLSKEYDLLTKSSENFIYLAMSKLILKRGWG
jgi:putative transposase